MLICCPRNRISAALALVHPYMKANPEGNMLKNCSIGSSDVVPSTDLAADKRKSKIKPAIKVGAVTVNTALD